MKIPKEYLDEIKGYSDGSGIQYEHLFFANFYFDVLKEYGFHCSTIAHHTKIKTLIGRNTDLMPLLTKFALKHGRPLIITVNNNSNKNKQEFTHVAIPLCVGVINGFNEKGISAHSHQILFVREKSNKKLLATPILMRKILEESKTIKQAENIIQKNPTCRSLNVLINSEKEKKSKIVSTNPTKMDVVSTKEKFICCTTHFQTEKMKKLHNGPIYHSELRLKSMNKLMRNKKKLTTKQMIRILKDHENGLDYGDSSKSLTNDGTYQSFVIDLTEKKIFISNANKKPVSLYGEFVEIDIKKLNKN
ncbi:hypothetical protein HOK51_08630 [Candidatus Woesearchaeota archaeon]|jgi:predicted choloylglycine hydrolase|nr:hypothetical protein [Candidatus Woesearchaeota archaeon]MBT6519892.1 hypothetical protein [Candidatus Woesearchaeota archaeon]